MVVLTAANNHTVVASRNVTNVGDATSSYTVQVASAKGMSMIVSPEQLSFTEANQVLQYTVTFSTQSSTASAYSGYVQWVSSDEAIIVRSPVIVVVL
ncbi:subtilisin-like protease SBT1.7 [Canna indica]|uniref:Subtilisin-like protease SBT1.7 n=1 Tax=Canna indica TaxID=4628 RepID=A0AAQ3QDD3_9LILI|nr:subtilisin-like protease SBT1.7 [Canna indica]